MVGRGAGGCGMSHGRETKNIYIFILRLHREQCGASRFMMKALDLCQDCLTVFFVHSNVCTI